MAKIDGQFSLVNAISMVEQANNVSTPDTGKWKLFFKSGGLYAIDDAGTVTGPLGTGGGGGSGVGDTLYLWSNFH